MATLQKIAPCLWFDKQAEDAAKFYVAQFPDSGIDAIAYYGREGFEIHGQPAGSVMTVDFHLAGQRYTGLNGGPEFQFSEAISLQVFCDDQRELDRYWNALSEGGQPGPCGWLKDRFGVSWQIVPSELRAMTTDRDQAKAQRVMKALLQMKKLDIATLQRAYRGEL
jgi:predicted 3-demethylubiquinone-9 3-methyltransferase (glyoxalase superfamily)